MKITTNNAIKEWGKRIDGEVKVRKDFRKRIVEIEKIYSGKSSPYDLTSAQNQPGIDYNILWVNCQILLAALYSRNPRPDVRRRYKDSGNPTYNDIGKDVATLLERALVFVQDVEDFYGNSSSAVLSFVKFAAGQMRVKYVMKSSPGMPKRITVIQDDEQQVLKREDTGEAIDAELIDSVMSDEMGYFMEEPTEELEYEELQPEWIPLTRFHWEPVAAWKDVSWCVIDHFLTREELVDQFGETKANKIPLCYNDEGERPEEGTKEAREANRALVRECFDKRNLKVQIFAEGLDELLEDVDDPYNLEGFYPFPKPMLGTMGDDGLNPVPDYIYYQSQHAELNTITARINKLLKVVKYRGIYDGSFTQMPEMQALDDGEFKAAGNFAELASVNGGKLRLEDMIATMPIAEANALIDSLYMKRDQVVKVIYEITGISDIVRGSTKASETLGAQELKSQYASLRLQNKQKEVERFFRDFMRIQSEFMAEHFDSETLQGMTGIEVTPEMIEILSSDLLRSYIVDVETDSTAMIDTAAEQKERIEAMQAMTQSIQQLAPLVQMGLPVTLIAEMVLFTLKGFKGARELEDMIQDLIGQISQPQALQNDNGGAPPVEAVVA